MKKNIVFDMGNVLVSYQPKQLIAQYTTHSQDQQLLFAEIIHSVDWLKFDRGSIEKEELIHNVSQRIPIHLKKTALELLNDWYKGIQPIHEMESVLQTLKKQYHLFILSNASSDFHKFSHKIPCFNQFNGVFLSSDWHMLKPEKEIYQTFYSHFQLIPSECFFIDDMPANIEQALNTGMQGFIFRNNFDQLKETLAYLNKDHDKSH